MHIARKGVPLCIISHFNVRDSVVSDMHVSYVMHLYCKINELWQPEPSPRAHPKYPSASEFDERLDLHRTAERNTVL